VKFELDKAILILCVHLQHSIPCLKTYQRIGFIKIKARILGVLLMLLAYGTWRERRMDRYNKYYIE
jgi:hypothetical protein